MYDSFGWKPYVPVAERRRKALKKMEGLRKKGRIISPVSVDGRTIAKTFWGKAWCENLESYSDYDNRLPRGRTYVRNGSVVDLQIAESQITALAVSSLFAAGRLADAQQITGTLGQADATTTINGKQLPPPPPKFGGVIKQAA